MSAADLNQPQTYSRLDPSGLGRRIAGLPQQCREAWEKARAFALPESYADVHRVVVAGMGGSAVGGGLLADLAALETAPPVVVCRDYNLPPFVDHSSLVIVSSYSGNTEETLSAYHQAVKRGAKIVAVTGGGKLAELAKEQGVPLLTVEYQGEPRSALGYSFLAPLSLLQNLGLLAGKTAAVEEALSVLGAQVRELQESVPQEDNPAKALARQLHGRIAVIYGAGHLSAVAYRWKTQINENAKAWAFAEVLPELDHNSVAGYLYPREPERLMVVLLSSPLLHPRVTRRYQVTGEALERAGVPYRVIRARGESPLAQILSCILMGDYASYYLALLSGVDPSPVEAIDYLKARLAEE